LYCSLNNIRFFFKDEVGRLKITAEKHILCYLWFVGHETASYRDVADRFGITLSALYNIITRVTDFILSLANNIIKYPNEAEKAETAAFYRNTNGFPGVIGFKLLYFKFVYFKYVLLIYLYLFLGAMDGSHIRIDRSTEDPDSYINRKQYFSVHIQGTVNHKMKFLDVFIGYPGSVHDSRVFRNSPLYRDLRELCGGKLENKTNYKK